MAKHKTLFLKIAVICLAVPLALAGIQLVMKRYDDWLRYWLLVAGCVLFGIALRSFGLFLTAVILQKALKRKRLWGAINLLAWVALAGLSFAIFAVYSIVSGREVDTWEWNGRKYVVVTGFDWHSPARARFYEYQNLLCYGPYRGTGQKDYMAGEGWLFSDAEGAADDISQAEQDAAPPQSAALSATDTEPESGAPRKLPEEVMNGINGTMLELTYLGEQDNVDFSKVEHAFITLNGGNEYNYAVWECVIGTEASDDDFLPLDLSPFEIADDEMLLVSINREIVYMFIDEDSRQVPTDIPDAIPAPPGMEISAFDEAHEWPPYIYCVFGRDYSPNTVYFYKTKNIEYRREFLSPTKYQEQNRIDVGYQMVSGHRRKAGTEVGRQNLKRNRR